MSARYKILIVDDEDDVEQLVRQRFRRQVRDGEYAFLFAQNGVEALEQLKEHADTDAVFSDINMPRMDGLRLLTELNERHPLLKTVIVSAYSDMDNIRTAMNRGAFDFICKPFDFEDFDRTLLKTIQSVDQLRQNMKAVHDNNILKMYVDESVLQFMRSKDFEESLSATEIVEATVVFIDLCGFTALSEQEAPDLVIRLLNKYFDVMVRAVIEHGGYVDKFIGDAVLAVFRGDAHAERAVQASLRISEQLDGLEEALPEGRIYLPRVTIGVNSGEVIAGNVGSEALRRFDFTVIGDVVNTAQRLQAAAKPGQVLISESVRDRIGAHFHVEQAGEKKLKNKSEILSLFLVSKG